MSGFHRCVTSQAKLPSSDPREDCVACLGPEHAVSALADRSFCALCANFQPRTLCQRARKAVGSHSPSSGSSYTLSVPPSSTATPPVALRGSKSPSQLTAGQRSPDRRRAHERSHSPSIHPRGSSPRRERSRRSRSRSLSPRRSGRSRSPREKSGVAELTSKMSQFMDVMMGQQSLLMSLTSRASPAESLASHSAFQPQPLVVPVVQQPQGVWDVDAISMDASEGESLMTWHPSTPSTTLSRRRWTPVIPCGHWWKLSGKPWNYLNGGTVHLGAIASSPANSRKASAFAMQGASEAGLASFPPVDAAFAALVKTPTLSGLVKDPTCPNKQCRTTEIHLKKGYLAATEAVRLSNVASLLSVYQASLVKDLPEHASASLRAELALVAQFLVKIAQLNARAQGRSIASLVVARRQLWLSQARVQEPDKAPLLDAPITPGHTFCPAVEEMLQCSVKAREASRQMAKMWPHKPFQPRRQQEHQWRRAPPQHQLRPGDNTESVVDVLQSGPSPPGWKQSGPLCSSGRTVASSCGTPPSQSPEPSHQLGRA
ncbi:UNVERIFIED_CONTAM: hypothetical protein FKN15_042721 [Acipenser sinensis]